MLNTPFSSVWVFNSKVGLTKRPQTNIHQLGFYQRQQHTNKNTDTHSRAHSPCQPSHTPHTVITATSVDGELTSILLNTSLVSELADNYHRTGFIVITAPSKVNQRPRRALELNIHANMSGLKLFRSDISLICVSAAEGESVWIRRLNKQGLCLGMQMCGWLQVWCHGSPYFD